MRLKAEWSIDSGARTARRQLEGRHLLFWRIFVELNNPKHTLSKMELNFDGGKHILAMFLNWELF